MSDITKRALLALKDMQARLDDVEGAQCEPIAIVGMACRFPGANGPAAFWEMLEAGQDGVSEVPSDRWEADAYYDPNPGARGKAYTKWGGFLRDPIGRFDAGFFGISNREAAAMDPQQRMMLEVTWEAFEDAGLPPASLRGSRTGVYAGISTHDYADLGVGDYQTLDIYAATGNAYSVVAGRISYLLDLQGPSIAVDTACSSSLVALHLACQGLRNREADVAVAGGVNAMLSPGPHVVFSRARALAADGRCKAFDAAADGYARGEGCGVIVLKRLSDARRDGDRIWALVRGSAINQDGRTNGLTAPSPASQADVIRQALANARVEAHAVDYVEAHGTGTPLGDPIEIEGIKAVYGAARLPGMRCRVGSVKANIGHLEAAAGIAGVIKAVLALDREAIPPLLHFKQLNPNISLDGANVELPIARLSWVRGERPRLAGVSSFGFSGTNGHVVLEEAPLAPPAAAPGGAGPWLLPISAHDPAALRALVRSHAAALAAPDAPAFDAWCHAAAAGRSALAQRLALVASDSAGAAAALAAYLAGDMPPGLAEGAVRPEAGRVVFVFSGHGAQWAGMGRSLLADEPVFREAVEACDRLIAERAGFSVIAALRGDAGGRGLEDIAVLQPAVFALQVGLAALWRSWGVQPAAVIGHSMGEVAASHVAGALSLEDAVRVIVTRGALMVRLVGHGAMALVQLSVAEAEQAILGLEDKLSVAVSNSPESTVLSGDAEALATVFAALKARDVFCRMIKAEGAGHCPQLEPLRLELVAGLAGITPQRASVPFYSTVTAGALDGSALDPAYWGRNMREPVMFGPAVRALIARGLVTFLELSAHPILTTAIGQCAPGDRPVLAVPSLKRDAGERTTLLASLGALFCAGVPIDWTARHAGPHPRLALPSYPWQGRRHWSAGSGEGPRARPAGGHPLLGRGTPLVLPEGAWHWEAAFDPEGEAFPAGFGVQGTPLLADAALLDLVQTAGRRVMGDRPFALEGVSLEAPWVPHAEAASEFQLMLVPDASGRLAFRVAGREGNAWRTVAAGHLAPGHVDAEPVAIDLPPGDGLAEAARLRDRLAADGWPPEAQLLRAWRTPERWVAELAGGTDARDGGFDPRWLQGALQWLGAATAGEGPHLLAGLGAGTWLLDGPLAAPLRLEATAPAGADGLRLRIVDANHRAVFLADGLAFRALDPAWLLVDGAAPGIQGQLRAAEASEQPALLEAYLQREFGRSLRIPAADIDRNQPLTELGLDSLVGVELRKRIEQGLGLTIPMTRFWDFPTVASLTTLLLEAFSPAAGGAGRPYDPIVAVRTSGTLPPFFCVHPVGGGVLCYRDLARHLPGDRPFYALRARGLDGEEPYTSIEAMASDYVAALRAIQPQGPYHLGGWSFGALVAVEMARQLVAADALVPCLVVIDLADERQMLELDASERLAFFVRDVLGVLGQSPPADAVAGWRVALSGTAPEARLEAALDLLTSAGGPGSGAALPDRDLLRSLYRVFSAHVEAMRAYAPAPYGGPACLILAEETRDRVGRADGGLGALLPMAPAATVLPGDHYALLAEPGVLATAAHVAAALAGDAVARLAERHA